MPCFPGPGCPRPCGMSQPSARLNWQSLRPSVPPIQYIRAQEVNDPMCSLKYSIGTPKEEFRVNCPLPNIKGRNCLRWHPDTRLAIWDQSGKTRRMRCNSDEIPAKHVQRTNRPLKTRGVKTCAEVKGYPFPWRVGH